MPEQDYAFDPEMAKQILDDAGWADNGAGEPRTKDGEDARVRPRGPLGVARQHPGARSWSPSRRPRSGSIFNVQVVSVDKLTEVTVRKVDGKPAPDFDTFIWGWGGDPYDPSFLLSLLTDG